MNTRVQTVEPVQREMKILFVSRASLFTVKGGDTIQLIKTAEALKRKGVAVDIKLCNEKSIDYAKYDLIHFFNIRHPADMLQHIKKSGLPYIISPIYVDYTKPVSRKTKGVKDKILNLFSIHAQEYIKTVGKSVLQGEKIISADYLWKGHRRSVQQILKSAAMLLPNSYNEYKRLLQTYGVEKKYSIVPNGADHSIFNCTSEGISSKDGKMVICVARIELIKNQLNLIKALNDSHFQLYLVGDAGPNHKAYYNECRKISGNNIHFIKAMPQKELAQYYKKAKVHVLPSWFETTGLASLEALFCGCNIVLTGYGDTKEYFDEPNCFYCDPVSVPSIRAAIEKAAATATETEYINSMVNKYNWKNAAEKTAAAYREVLQTNKPK